VRIYQSEVASIPGIICNDRWVSLQEVYNYFGLKHHTIMRWIDQCGMPASKMGKLWRFKAAGIDLRVKDAEPPMYRRK
jgi:excisionase family DNA binding protein